MTAFFRVAFVLHLDDMDHLKSRCYMKRHLSSARGRDTKCNLIKLRRSALRYRADMNLALSLLWDDVVGTTDNKRPSRARPEPGGPTEREARRALARLLYAA
jgi:hypothetical protein